MEIRILKEDELAYASGLSRFVFDDCLRNRMEFAQTIPFVENYISDLNLKSMVREGHLLVWGAIEEGRLIGIGGMQSDGMITLLYVLPQYAQQGCGRALIKTMKIYAQEQLGLMNITVNATPSWTAPYFQKQGFVRLCPDSDMQVPFVPMQAEIRDVAFATKEKITFSTVALAGMICIGFATIVGIVFMVSYLF